MTVAVAPESRTRVDAVRLEALTTAIFGHLGMPDRDAATTARGLVAADLRGLSGTGFGAMLGPDNVGHFLGAIRVDAFRPADEVKAMMDELVRELRRTPPAGDFEEVLVAGDPEERAERDRRAHGIPLHPRVLAMLASYAQRLGRPFDLVD